MSDNSRLSRRNRNYKNRIETRISGKHSKVLNTQSLKKATVENSDIVSLPDETNHAKLKVRASLISKKFELSQNEKLKELLGIGGKSRGIKDFWALRNINFKVYDGEAIGIVGLNGSGKSTLLNIIDKSLSLTTGELKINGEISQIAIGAGLKIDLTGRDNIRLKGTMMGMTKKEIDDKMDEIIQFSELGPFIDRQVKDYSSGMRSKLAFSIAVNQDPDILIIDEALSVGDSTFAAKSAKKMFEFRERGKTIFVVSHNIGQIQKWTDRVIWLHYGEVKEYGATKEVLPKYQAFINWFNKLSKEQQEQYKLDRRQEQLDYSVEALKQEIIENSSSEVSQHSLAVIDRTIAKNKHKTKLSWPTRIMMCLCFIFMVYTVVLSAKSGIADKVNKAEGTQKTVVKSSTKPKKSSESKPQKSSTQKKSSTKAQETFDYIVQEGDTLSGIAAAYGITSDEIHKLNPQLDPSLITVGMVIKLPKSVEGKSPIPESVANSDQTTTDVPNDSVNSGQGDGYNPYPTVPQTPTPNPGTPDQGGTDQGGTDQGGTDQGGTDQGGTDQGGTDQGSTDQGGTDSGPQDPEIPVS